MKELTNEQIEQIEWFKKWIEERLEDDWKFRLKNDNFDAFHLSVLSRASGFFEREKIPFSIIYDELTAFCYKKLWEHLHKET